MPVDETRAVAKLPHVDIEIRHRKVPEEGAEYLSISLKASPDLDSVAAFLDPFRLADPGRLFAAWASFNPWLSLANPFAFWGLAGRALPGRDGQEGRPG
ncbi:hypothetical protein [Benzoatithermus flavus]|uniref:Uncharacterized protein n=1 Tax=Benzoatithermus flavus TaxID=3108223 RepID=A0ABU8XQD1_9PROT